MMGLNEVSFLDKEAARRLNLKNGWDLPKNKKPPLTGRKQELIRAYELLVKKTDEEYIREAEERRKSASVATEAKKQEAAQADTRTQEEIWAPPQNRVAQQPVPTDTRTQEEIWAPPENRAAQQPIPADTRTQEEIWAPPQNRMAQQPIPADTRTQEEIWAPPQNRVEAERETVEETVTPPDSVWAPPGLRPAQPDTQTPEQIEKTEQDTDIQETPEEDWHSQLRDETDDGWRARRKKKVRIALGIIVAAILVVGGRLLFGPPILLADLSAYEDASITVEGLTDEPFEITPKELSKMKLSSVSVDVHEEELGPDDVPELGKAIGPNLETFLAKYGKDLDDIRTMKVYSGSGKGTAYVHTLEEHDIILSVANGRTPLGEKEAPLRIAVADTNANEWSGWIRRIVFTMKTETENTE